MMDIGREVSRILRLSIVGGAALASIAQAQQVTAEAETELEEVSVTGSRIRSDGMSTPTPVTAVTVEDLSVAAPTTLAAALAQLPQFNNSSVPEGAPAAGWTGASGASILNLRGVGQNRTLVLLDGRRVVPSSRRGTIDVNLMPDPLMRRVDVVTGGASAAYGSDAVSGVVNFVLDTKYEGLQANVQGGVTELGDNQNLKLGLAGGTRLGDRTHLIGALDYYHAEPIKDATDRDWQQSWGVIANPLASQPGQPARITRNNVRSRQFTQGGLILTGPFAFQQFMPGGTLAPFTAGTDVTANTQVGGSGVDLSWFNYFTPESTRGSGFAHLSYELSDKTTLFLQGLVGMNESSYLSPPAGGQFANWFITIYGDNAYLPQTIAQTMTANQSFRLGRAGDLDYGASKEIKQENLLQSVTTGLKSKLGDWTLDAYYQYGRTDSDIYMDNAIRLDRIYQAIDAVRTTGGQVVCRSTLMYPTNGCVPMNVFGVGAPSQAAIDWITQDISQKQLVQQHVADISISGSPFRNWVGDVSFATGVSWREDAFRQDVYPVALHSGTDMPVIGPALGYKGLPTVYSGNPNIFERGPSANPRGHYNVSEAFGEMQLPLLGQTAVSKSLSLNTAVRYADYQGSGGVWAWKAGLDWQLTDELRLRGTRSRDVRAGSLSERFDSSRGPGNVTDPASGSATQYAITVIAGGNPNVNPEKADTLTFGAVYRPSWASGLALSVDAFEISIDDAIGQLGAQAVVDQCFAGATQLCGYVQRDSANVISVVENLFINTDQSKTRGVDIEASYRQPINLFGGGESLGVRLLTSYIDELSTTLAGAAKVDRAGQTGLAGGAPEWQGSMNLNYNRGAFSATLQERYIAGGTYDATWTSGLQIDDNSVPEAWLTNLQLGYDGTWRGFGDYRLSLNVNNLFDVDPPLVASWGFTGSQATNSALFDMYGRRYSLGLKVKF
jgi:outer membrane receptor protein involved in Fe transport